MATPLPKSTELLSRLEGISRTENIRFILSSVERDAHKILNSDPVRAWEIFGIIAMLRSDYSAMREAFDNALSLRSNDLHLRINYSKALNNIGFLSESVELMWELCLENRDNLAVLSDAARMFYFSLAFDKYLTVCEMWHGLCPEKSLEDESWFDHETLKSHLSLLEERGISSSEIIKRKEVVSRLLDEHYPDNVDKQLSIEADGSLYVESFIPTSSQEAAERNIEIAELIADHFEDMLPDVALFTTNPK